MLDYLLVSLFSITMTLLSVGFGYVLAKTWLDKRLNVVKKPEVQP